MEPQAPRVRGTAEGWNLERASLHLGHLFTKATTQAVSKAGHVATFELCRIWPRVAPLPAPTPCATFPNRGGVDRGFGDRSSEYTQISSARLPKLRPFPCGP